MNRKMRLRVLLIIVLALSFGCISVVQDSHIWDDNRLQEIADEIVSIYPNLGGIDFSLQQATSYGNSTMFLSLNAMLPENKPAEVIALVLSCVEKLTELDPPPTLLVIWAHGAEQLFLDGNHLPTIARIYKSGEGNKAWLALIENATKPDGSKLELPDDPESRMEAALDSVDIILPVVESVFKPSEEKQLVVQSVFIPLQDFDRYLLDVTTDIIQTTGEVWKYTWQIRLRNKINKPLRILPRILFYDADGVALDAFEGEEIIVGAKEQKIISGDKIMSAEIASKIKRIEVHLIQQKRDLR